MKKTIKLIGLCVIALAFTGCASFLTLPTKGPGLHVGPNYDAIYRSQISRAVQVRYEMHGSWPPIPHNMSDFRALNKPITDWLAKDNNIDTSKYPVIWK